MTIKNLTDSLDDSGAKKANPPSQKLEIVKIKKTKPPEENVSGDSLSLSKEKTNLLNKERVEKDEERNLYGKTVINCLWISTYILLANTNPFTSLLLTLVVRISTKKYNDSMRALAQIVQAEASERIQSLLLASFSPKQATIYSVLDEQDLLSDRKPIDHLIVLSSKLSIAISVRTILPPKDENEFIKVYVDNNKNQLVYRKGKKSGKRTFNSDPIKEIKLGASWLSENRKNLTRHLPTCLIVMTDPIIIDLKDTKPHLVREIDSEAYLYIEDVYVVEEKRLITLINSLNKAREQILGQKS